MTTQMLMLIAMIVLMSGMIVAAWLSALPTSASWNSRNCPSR